MMQCLSSNPSRPRNVPIFVVIPINHIIYDRTFPVPVITPFELEVGHGARSWDSSINTNLGIHILRWFLIFVFYICHVHREFAGFAH